MRNRVMLCDFYATFHPTQEQKENDEKIIEQAYKEQWCCTCKNYIPADDSLPGFIISYSECKLGGLTSDRKPECNDYISDKEE